VVSALARQVTPRHPHTPMLNRGSYDARVCLASEPTASESRVLG
jgi:hypothetical protein